MRTKDENTAHFENIYLTYYSKMKNFAKVYVSIEEEAENIVQDVFAELWENRKKWFGYANLVSYLFVSTKNRCLNYLRHQEVLQSFTNNMQEEFTLTVQASLNSLEALDLNFLSDPDNLEEIIKKALDSLPERCRQIFVMNKIEGKKQKEIAATLQISINTVETQMSIAYKYLRQYLKKYPFLLFLMCF